MSAVRQKRKSCEACRARKLKCSGKETGCSRCVHLGLTCKFHEKGMPGRPRKWSLTETIQPLQASPSRQRQLPRKQQQLQQILHDNSAALRTPLNREQYQTDQATHSVFVSEESSSASTANTSDPLDVATVEPSGWKAQNDAVTLSCDEVGESLPFLDFDTSVQLDFLPLDSFQACLSHNHRETSPATHPTSPPPTPQSCDCSHHVFDTIRAINNQSLSHGIIPILRRGTSLFEQLLNCAICYDMSQPPRITLQNVLLIGRLTILVLMRYQAYFKWLKVHYPNPETDSSSETIYLYSSVTLVDMAIGRPKLYDIITEGLKADLERLVELGRQFEIRQKMRHSIGHGNCPDVEGRCWREKDDLDPDPLDICPQSLDARALIPCFRIVDEVKSKIKVFEETLAQA